MRYGKLSGSERGTYGNLRGGSFVEVTTLRIGNNTIGTNAWSAQQAGRSIDLEGDLTVGKVLVLVFNGNYGGVLSLNELMRVHSAGSTSPELANPLTIQVTSSSLTAETSQVLTWGLSEDIDETKICVQKLVSSLPCIQEIVETENDLAGLVVNSEQGFLLLFAVSKGEDGSSDVKGVELVEDARVETTGRK